MFKCSLIRMKFYRFAIVNHFGFFSNVSRIFFWKLFQIFWSPNVRRFLYKVLLWRNFLGLPFKNVLPIFFQKLVSVCKFSVVIILVNFQYKIFVQICSCKSFWISFQMLLRGFLKEIALQIFSQNLVLRIFSHLSSQ